MILTIAVQSILAETLIARVCLSNVSQFSLSSLPAPVGAEVPHILRPTLSVPRRCLGYIATLPPCLVSLSLNSSSPSGLWPPSRFSSFWSPPQCRKTVALNTRNIFSSVSFCFRGANYANDARCASLKADLHGTTLSHTTSLRQAYDRSTTS